MPKFQIPLIDRYLIRQLIPPWILSLSLCSILGEVIGISFEQVKFITERDFSLLAALQVHLLKFPAFLSLGLPFSLLMATIITYSKLAENNEITALKTCGVSLLRLITPALVFSLILTIFMFYLNAIIVPPANYRAAMMIENEFQIERSSLQKYHQKNIIYQEFSPVHQSRSLKRLIIADRFDGKKLVGLTLLEYQQGHLHSITTANSAVWHQLAKSWILANGSQQIIDRQQPQPQINRFKYLTLPIDQNLLNYVQNYRDNREMNLRELYQWLDVLQGSNDQQKIRQLKINIQERYALPCSCVVFALLGGILGCSYLPKINRLSMVIAIIIGYQGIQFITTSLSVTGVIPVNLGIWLPNIIGLVSSGIFLQYFELPWWPLHRAIAKNM
jgi:lipopolysaccharide export system permease protein